MSDSSLTIKSDVLYGISLRPQELALFGSEVRCSLRYAPIADDPKEKLHEIFKILVLEIHCSLPPDLEVGREKAVELELLKIGWQLELYSTEGLTLEEVPEDPKEVPMLLNKMAETVAGLAKSAGIDNPLHEGFVEQLLKEYRSSN